MKKNRVVGLILSFVLLISISFFYENFFSDIKDNKIVLRMVDPYVELDEDSGIDELLDIEQEYHDNDIVGLLKINGAELYEPVVQYSDNDYYLSHDIYGNYDAYGTTFMDYRIDLESSKKILIFGHNSSKRKTPFQELEKYYDKEYYDNHKYITLITENEVRTYEVFSVFVEVSDWSYMNLNFNNEGEYYNHLLKLKNKSFYDTGIDIRSEDEVMILQTCSYHKNYYEYSNKYLLIISRRVK